LILRTKISDSSYTEYTWDYRNRLTSVTDKTSGGTATMSATYTYDVYDRRIKKVVDPDGTGAAGSTTNRYVYDSPDGTDIVLQFDGSNNLTHRDLWGPMVDQLLADEDASNNLLWPLVGRYSTVRDLINNSGVVQNHIKYDAFGNVTNESAPTVDFLMGFAGTDRDEETGASYSWHRYLQNGRWISEDPIEFDSGDTNLMRDVFNMPVHFRDPSGLATGPANNPMSWLAILTGTMTESGFTPVSGFISTPVLLLAAGGVWGDIWDWIRTTAGYAGPAAASEASGALEASPGLVQIKRVQNARNKMEEARRTNDPKKLEKAMDEYQKVLRESKGVREANGNPSSEPQQPQQPQPGKYPKKSASFRANGPRENARLE
jgi:RHS repeat-associated protein